MLLYVGGASEEEVVANTGAAQRFILSECSPVSSEPTASSAGVTLHATHTRTVTLLC